MESDSRCSLEPDGPPRKNVMVLELSNPLPQLDVAYQGLVHPL